MEWIPLKDEEVRVLGALIEKEMTTPQYYPMTVNALKTACNQKSSRDPVVSYADHEVQDTLNGLIRQKLVGRVTGMSSRTEKYRHRLAAELDLEPEDLAALGVLMLRGPQTTGEVRSRTGRMYSFTSTDAAHAVLEKLVEREIAVLLPVQPGKKEARYMHLLAGAPDLEALAAAAAASSPRASNDRMAALEAEVASLKEQVARLQAAFEAFRTQFE